MSDNAMTYRIVVKEIANQHGVYATFMPKPLFGENGSGMHTHQSLFSDGSNAFYDGDDPHHLSATAKSLHRRAAAPCARDRCAVRAQREQLQAAGSRLRGAGLLRVVAAQPLRAGAGAGLPPGQGAGDALRAALPRPLVQPLPDVRGDAARGARGDRAGLRVPGADGAQPLRAHATTSASTRGIEQLPETLGEAIEELAGSELVRKALGDHIFERYVDLKREEWEEYRVQVTKWELERYLPIPVGRAQAWHQPPSPRERRRGLHAPLRPCRRSIRSITVRITLTLAYRFESASTRCHGAYGWSVRAIMSSTACSYSPRFSRLRQSSSVSFQRLQRVLRAALEALQLLRHPRRGARA